MTCTNNGMIHEQVSMFCCFTVICNLLIKKTNSYMNLSQQHQPVHFSICVAVWHPTLPSPDLTGLRPPPAHPIYLKWRIFSMWRHLNKYCSSRPGYWFRKKQSKTVVMLTLVSEPLLVVLMGMCGHRIHKIWHIPNILNDCLLDI